MNAQSYIAVHVSKTRSILARKSVSAGYVKVADVLRHDVPKLLILLNLGVVAEETASLPYVEAAERDALLKKDERVAGQVIARAKNALQGVS